MYIKNNYWKCNNWRNVYIGPGKASLRGDWGQITIKDGCNVQDNCIIHIFPGKDVVLQENAHIGHINYHPWSKYWKKHLSRNECSDG